jgi:diadenosine tetraphosphate (Ap4A) HIT family hydrolase
MTQNSCGICSWIDKIKTNPDYLIKELSTGYAVLSKYQYKYTKGYTIFLCKQHVNELHDLDDNFKIKFLKEMSQIAEAIFKAFKPDKLNYELLGNTEPHLHWHIFPRYKNDPNFSKPIWVVDKNIRQASSTIISQEEIKQLKNGVITFIKN